MINLPSIIPIKTDAVGPSKEYRIYSVTEDPIMLRFQWQRSDMTVAIIENRYGIHRGIVV